jgi:hypothetical protein
MDHVNAEVLYPRLLRRVRAFLIDSVIFIILSFAWMVSLPAFGESAFLVTSTVVVLRRPESLPAHEKFVARSEDRARYIYPSKLRRVAVILLYAFLGFAIFTALSVASLSHQCLSHIRFTPGEKIVFQLLRTLWVLSLGASIVLGWRGLLHGCRRTPLPKKCHR